MEDKPTPWRLDRKDYDPDDKVRELKSRFGKISTRYVRSRRRNKKRLFLIIAFIFSLGITVASLLALSPWSPMITIRHVLSYPGCDASRFVGLAPAIRGTPGYWPSHDADNDGIACEPWPR